MEPITQSAAVAVGAVVATATSEINGAITAQVAITAIVFLGFEFFDRELFLGSKNAGRALRKYDKRNCDLPREQAEI